MTTEELMEKLELIQKMKCETSTLEIKSAEQGCPQRLYDTLSAFQIRMMVESLFLAWTKNTGTKK